MGQAVGLRRPPRPPGCTGLSIGRLGWPAILIGLEEHRTMANKELVSAEVAHPLGYEVWPSPRIRTQHAPARYPVPDLCVTQGEPSEDVFTEPPFLCLEILSPGGPAVEVLAEIREYLAFGVTYGCIVDPNTGTGETHTPDGIERVENGSSRASDIEVS